MFKFSLMTGFLAITLLSACSEGWCLQDIEARFFNGDFTNTQSIFIDIKDVPLVEVLKIISKQSGMSFIAAEDVAEKKITLYINKVPFNQALQMILDANNLTYEMQEGTNVFVVKAKYQTEKTKITKVYQLKYATVSSSKINSTLSFTSGTGPLTASTSGTTTTTGTSTSSSGIMSGGLEQAVKDALTKDGKIIEDARTNSLIITDVPGQFPLIESTIAKLDVPIPQILIEVEMLDVSKSVADQLGVTYGATPIAFTGAKEAVNYPLSLSRGTPSSTSGSSSSSSSSSGSSSGSGSVSPFTSGSIDTSGLLIALNYLTTHTDARTLARPRILTLNNETAQIEISTDQAISIETTTSSTGTATSVTGNSIERYTTGVILKVTPQANLLTREITMAISPKVVDVILSQVQPAASTGLGTIYDPETRGSDSKLKLKDGQSMVIGGLMNNQENTVVTKLPILGDLPIIGSAFRSTSKQKKERELLIFLTPHIIDDNDQRSLKGGNLPSTPSASDMLESVDRHAEEIDHSLNTYEPHQY